MESGNIAALRAELETARSTLLPQIQGLTDLAAIPNLSATTFDVVARELRDHVRRVSMIDGVLAGLLDLEADGYPEMPPVTVPADIYYELLGQQSAIAAALAEFNAAALSAIITLGTPVDQ